MVDTEEIMYDWNKATHSVLVENRVILLAGGCCGTVIFILKRAGVYGDLGDFVQYWFLFVNITMLSLWVGLYWCPNLAASWYSRILTAMLIVSGLGGALTADRWEKLFEDTVGHVVDEDTRPLAEARSVLFVFIVVVLGPCFFRLTSLECLLISTVSVVGYLVSTAVLGSTEVETLQEYWHDEDSRGRMGGHIAMAVDIYLCGLLILFCYRRQTAADFSVFVHDWVMEKGTQIRKELNEKITAKLEDMQLIEDALENPDGILKRQGSSETSAKNSEELYESTNGLNAPEQIPQSKISSRKDKTVAPPTFLQVSLKADLKKSALVPNETLVRRMHGQQADWDRIRDMAENCDKPNYSLDQFFEDCIASFPELSLWLDRSFEPENQEGNALNGTSGRSNFQEYQRTIGALFAVYWLLRLDLDGKHSFCFGVGNDWHANAPKCFRPPPERRFIEMSDQEKRYSFFFTMDWSKFEGVVQQAGCEPGVPANTERIMAMLCLTSFHDIMKNEDILPTVQPEHAPFLGYSAGEVIHDHDIALGYILEHYPDLLPSFSGLPAAQRKSIAFTQGKMQFNHGWFVQAEAPPGPLLSRFKAAVSAGASELDVGFYFFHWFTDLAGAEATPLGGAEKFVIKFPHAVLSSFIWSIPFLTQLAQKSETTVMEEYLEGRWLLMDSYLELPFDSFAIAKMRLVAMAQSDSDVVSLFEQLPPKEKFILAEELQRTGIEGQVYTRVTAAGGPAFLVYYGPAMLQRSLLDGRALFVLARVLQTAREMWPVKMELEGCSVTIHIAELKSASIDDVFACCPEPGIQKVWVMLRQNAMEASVKLKRVSELNALLKGSEDCRIVSLDIDGGPTGREFSTMSV